MTLRARPKTYAVLVLILILCVQTLTLATKGVSSRAFGV